MARTAAARDEAVADQPVDRLAHGDARHLEFLGQIALGRDRFLGLDDLSLDRVAQDFLKLQVKRCRIVLLERTHAFDQRSEEHTSELQSLMRISYAVFCLKKKKQQIII